MRPRGQRLALRIGKESVGQALGAEAATLSIGTAKLYYLDVTPGFYGIPYIVAYVLDPGAPQPLVLVDPGPRNPAAEKLRALLEALGAPRREVVAYATHVHIDHAGSLGSLAKSLGGSLARVYTHPRGAPHLVDPGKLWSASRAYLGWIAEGYGAPEPLPEETVKPTADGEAHRYGPLRVTVLHTPGHASHHQSIHVEAEGAGDPTVLFPGDSAGMAHPAADAVAPTTPPPFRLDMYLESLRRQIALHPSLVAYTHTGPAAPQCLERHLRQVERWRSYFQGLGARVCSPSSPEEHLERLRGIDEELDRFIEYAASKSKALLAAILHSIDGFLDYHRRLAGCGNQ